MTSKEYLIKNLIKWKSLFKGIQIKYAYDKNTDYHIIEISPEEIRRGSEEYAVEEMNLWESFFEKFSNEDILISSPSPCNDMSNILYQI